MLNGKFIGIKEKASVFELETKIVLSAAQSVILKATALGVYYVKINGRRVDENYLAPGWTNYKKTLQVQEYDISSYVREGENTITIVVGEGWCCGLLCWDGRRDYGSEQSAVCADVFADGKRILSTDESWFARESYIRNSGIYDGETLDLTADCKPLTAVEVPFDKTALTPQMSEPVRTTKRLAVQKTIRTPKGELVYDFGQNIAGIAEVKTPPDFCGTLVLKFAEILVGGNFYTDNLRSAKATDTFTASGAHVFSPEFTFHGFRYVKVEGAELPAECFTALVRHTDLKRTGRMEIGNARVQRLYENAVWGQRGNFVDIPSDCPQRDERLGWTGDINAFCRTAAYNYDIRKFMKKWLKTLRDDQRENGEMPHVSPNVLQWYHTGAMWSDVITMAPWNLYRMYGDRAFLEDNFEAMRKFIARREQTMKDGLIASGQEYGDWLALDKEILADTYWGGRTNVYYLTNVLHAESLRIVKSAAEILGRAQEAAIYEKKYEEHLARVREEYFTKRGRLAFDTVTAQVAALHFHIVPSEYRAELAAQLNENVKKHDYRMVTGFIGSPFLLFALADNGYFETARRVLLNNAFPGWLYEVDMGATTVWERWNSLMPDGTPNPDGMNSYNHYAYGSVMEFVYRRIAGIEEKEAGFKKIVIAPHPAKGLPALRAEYESVSGKIVSGYTENGGKIVYEIEIPSGIEAEIRFPDEESVFVTGGRHTFERDSESLSEAPYTPESPIVEVTENPKASRAFFEAFGDLFSGGAIERMKSEHKTLGDLAESCEESGVMNASEFSEKLKKANDLFLQK